MDNKKIVACSNNKQIVIYELLTKAESLLNLNSETLLTKFIHFAKNMEEVRKKWLESEAKCKDLEQKLKMEKSMYQRTINELKIDIESHYEKYLQAENKSERLQNEMEKLQKQFEMFKKILNDKNNDDERLNLMSYYQSNIHNHHQNNNEFSRRHANRVIEDTGSIISDYTEDDIDLPVDENNLDVCNINYNDSPVKINKPNATNQHDDLINSNLFNSPSVSSFQHCANRRSSNCGRKRNQRHSASLNRNGENRDKKRSRTRSTEIANREILKEIKAITTLKIGENGQPLTVTSEIQHNNQENLKSQLNRISTNSNKMELSFVPPRVKNRKKRPSREFLQRSADESQSIEDSEFFWNGSDAIVEEIASSNFNNNNIFQKMTPIIEAPTPQSSRLLNSNYKFIPANPNTMNTPGSNKLLGNQPKSLSANSVMPLARKYKKSHLFKGQVILNSEVCANCDKRTKFGKMVMKCRECELVVHTECKDQIQRPCYPVFNFPSQGKISDYCLDETPHIPPILQIIINEIEQRGLLAREVGLYRVNGSDSQIKQLKDRLIKRHQVPDLRKINDVHVLCSFVKDFLNNLTEHVITYESWYRFSKACELQNEIERTSAIEEAIQDLPEANRDTLAFLILHLQRISEQPDCKMPISNLARVFGQSIVGNSSANLPNVEIINEVKLQHQIVENLIRLPSAFYQSFIDGGNDFNNRLFKTSTKTPDQMRKSKTAVVLSSILGPASNIPPTAYQQIQQTQQFIAQQHQQQNSLRK